MNSANKATSRIKRAELLSGVGAVVLGMGLGLLFANSLKPYLIPILLVGLVMHAWGMFDKHRSENAPAKASPWWSELLYWVCWVALLALVLFVTAGYIGRYL